MSADVEAPQYMNVKGSGVAESWKAYRIKVRSGDMGSLPAVIGLVVLVILFSLANPVFFTSLNFANFFTQAAVVMILAMGLIFVLLLGEIDLSAGVTSGVAGALLAVSLSRWGFAWPLAIAVAMLAGIAIGLFIGTLVAKIGIPSFVVTLALFLAFQGLILVIIGEGGNVRVTDSVILSFQNENLPIWLGWVFYVVIIAGYFLASYFGRTRRLARGFAATSLSMILIKTGVMAVIGFAMVWALSLERSTNPELNPLSGVPIIVPIIAVLTLVFGFVLNRTTFGRHVYAVGGNVEAARRAGISVSRIRITVFTICSGTAAFAGIVFASRAASVDPNAGKFIVLNAIAAAVIGGTSLFGGRGRIHDALIGGAVVAVIDNGMGLLGYSAGVKLMITGSVLMLAAGADALSRKRSQGVMR
ncbi:MAG: ABC transporter permease [Candidatus Nanopelagicales bacterium]|jgi:D-xylose transport system permease protein|nr:ABC transporter permease [Actinomycetes bacterium]